MKEKMLNYKRQKKIPSMNWNVLHCQLNKNHDKNKKKLRYYYYKDPIKLLLLLLLLYI